MATTTSQLKAVALSTTDLVAQFADFERQLAALGAELDHSQRLAMLGTVAAMVAHEVNNLMTPILTYAEMAQEHPDDAGLVQKALARASAGAQQASRITGSILALTRASDRLECDVAAAVGDAVACVPRGTLRGIEIEQQLQPGLVAAISQVSLQQVVLNLVLNSVKALAGRAGRVMVRSTLYGASAVRIEIEDDGPGLAEGVAARVFEPFSSGSGGTGLGLAICDRLVREAGGTIWLANPGAAGARFCIMLPRAQ